MVLYIRGCVNCAGFQKLRAKEGSLARLLIPVKMMRKRQPSSPTIPRGCTYSATVQQDRRHVHVPTAVRQVGAASYVSLRGTLLRWPSLRPFFASHPLAPHHSIWAIWTSKNQPRDGRQDQRPGSMSAQPLPGCWALEFDPQQPWGSLDSTPRRCFCLPMPLSSRLSATIPSQPA